jgi:hypothetical protein
MSTTTDAAPPPTSPPGGRRGGVHKQLWFWVLVWTVPAVADTVVGCR